MRGLPPTTKSGPDTKHESVPRRVAHARTSRPSGRAMLSRLGLRPVSGIEPLTSTEYDDVIRVMYCARDQKLQRRFQRMMVAMAQAIGIDQMLPVSAGAIAGLPG